MLDSEGQGGQIWLRFFNRRPTPQYCDEAMPTHVGPQDYSKLAQSRSLLYCRNPPPPPHHHTWHTIQPPLLGIATYLPGNQMDHSFL